MTRLLDYRPSVSKSDNYKAGPSALVVSRWLGPGIRTCLEVANMVVDWWIVVF